MASAMELGYRGLWRFATVCGALPQGDRPAVRPRGPKSARNWDAETLGNSACRLRWTRHEFEISTDEREARTQSDEEGSGTDTRTNAHTFAVRGGRTGQGNGLLDESC